MAAMPDTDERNYSVRERVSRLEGGYEHVATKADIERVLIAVERNRTENERVLVEVERVRTEIERVRVEVERVKADLTKMVVRLAGLGLALMSAGFAFLKLTGTG